MPAFLPLLGLIRDELYDIPHGKQIIYQMLHLRPFTLNSLICPPGHFRCVQSQKQHISDGI